MSALFCFYFIFFTREKLYPTLSFSFFNNHLNVEDLPYPGTPAFRQPSEHKFSAPGMLEEEEEEEEERLLLLVVVVVVVVPSWASS